MSKYLCNQKSWRDYIFNGIYRVSNMLVCSFLNESMKNHVWSLKIFILILWTWHTLSLIWFDYNCEYDQLRNSTCYPRTAGDDIGCWYIPFCSVGHYSVGHYKHMGEVKVNNCLWHYFLKRNGSRLYHVLPIKTSIESYTYYHESMVYAIISTLSQGVSCFTCLAKV